MPSDEEYAHATASLEACSWSVDYVFTHEVPYRALAEAVDWDYAVRRRDPRGNELQGYLQFVDERLDRERLRMWYAGHYHVDRRVVDERHCVLYHEVVALGEAPLGEAAPDR